MKFNAIIPELSVSDIETSKNFYINILGFKLEYERAADSFAFLSFGKAQLMIEELNGNWSVGELLRPFGRGINFQIETDNVMAIADRLKARNIALFRDVMVNSYKCGEEVINEKEIIVSDPDGYLLRFSETKQDGF